MSLPEYIGSAGTVVSKVLKPVSNRLGSEQT